MRLAINEPEAVIVLHLEETGTGDVKLVATNMLRPQDRQALLTVHAGGLPTAGDPLAQRDLLYIETHQLRDNTDWVVLDVDGRNTVRVK